ncbi:hypothetical protein BpHYR1_017757 [Brachionus plicatilis]|uniref:Uncharacterized protein n=1 Tax=Brachionus plicatilis TaxID=10195 RepID=A0A3M7S6G2_BRAPC|nr:hypothetical protein BpHYR1_017757 [Brachionus plicatilis]
MCQILNIQQNKIKFLFLLNRAILQKSFGHKFRSIKLKLANYLSHYKFSLILYKFESSSFLGKKTQKPSLHSKRLLSYLAKAIDPLLLFLPCYFYTSFRSNAISFLC